MLVIIKISIKYKINLKINNIKCMGRNRHSAKGLGYLPMIKIPILQTKSKKLIIKIYWINRD